MADNLVCIMTKLDSVRFRTENKINFKATDRLDEKIEIKDEV